jgi:hypothetical protein
VSRVLVALYVVGAVFSVTGIYLSFTVDKFLGAGMVLVGAALIILPYTRQRF